MNSLKLKSLKKINIILNIILTILITSIIVFGVYQIITEPHNSCKATYVV